MSGLEPQAPGFKTCLHLTMSYCIQNRIQKLDISCKISILVFNNLLPPIFFPPRSLKESERKEREQMKKQRETRINKNFATISPIPQSLQLGSFISNFIFSFGVKIKYFLVQTSVPASGRDLYIMHPVPILTPSHSWLCPRQVDAMVGQSQAGHTCPALHTMDRNISNFNMCLFYFFH